LALWGLVANGLRNRRKLEADDAEMLNLNAAKNSVEEALRLIREVPLLKEHNDPAA
jgi:hypothetical protein